MSDAPLSPFRPIDTGFLEIPVATVEILGRRVSCAGGGYFRLTPYPWSKWCLARLASDHQRKAAFYSPPPWEIDPDQTLRAKLRHYRGLQAMKGKLRRLLCDFAWDRMAPLFAITTPDTTEPLAAA